MNDERTLLLMRHAKSDYPPGVVDHDRPLAPRGRREAGLAGDWLRATAPVVDRVLCSTATRTRQTLACSKIDAPVQFIDRLYGASPGTVIDEINGVANDTVGTLLVLGHEPTTSAVAILLSGEGTNAEALERISIKFPTSGIAVLRVRGGWELVEPGSAALTDFHVPR